MDYSDFIKSKKQISGNFGFEASFMPDSLFDFQKSLVQWSLIKGRSAIFADTGLGKTFMELVWAENVIKHTNGKVLLLTPLAVSRQTVKEAEKFGIQAERSRDGKPKENITVTNYEQLSKFDENDYVGIICDESSILKGFSGQFRKDFTRFANKMQYRLLATATPSPNDFVELGTSSEALGELKYMDMLSQFFRDTSNDKNPQWSTPKYILKGHAEHNFWRWVVSWARAIKKPSDLGFSDEKHILPTLYEKEHLLKVTKPLPGELFARKAKTLTEQREERKITIEERAEKTAKLCENHDISIIWGHYNYETDFLEKFIPNAVQISGSDSDEAKEEKFNAFSDGQIERLITKPKISSQGLNWQHCNHMIFYPSHSYEQYYQGVRRCWRFGQKKDVFVDIVTTDGEAGIMANIQRKARDAEIMFENLVKQMNNELILENIEKNKIIQKLPNWIKKGDV
jgi:superfamily II DNA or RNA helicase